MEVESPISGLHIEAILSPYIQRDSAIALFSPVSNAIECAATRRLGATLMLAASFLPCLCFHPILGIHALPHFTDDFMII